MKRAPSDGRTRASYVYIRADAAPEEALSVLTAYPADLIEASAVSTAVNWTKWDEPELVEPLST